MADLVASGIVPLSAKFHLFGKGACADEEAGEKKKKNKHSPLYSNTVLMKKATHLGLDF